MNDCIFLASFLSMYPKNSLLFKKLINKVIIIITQHPIKPFVHR